MLGIGRAAHTSAAIIVIVRRHVHIHVIVLHGAHPDLGHIHGAVLFLPPRELLVDPAVDLPEERVYGGRIEVQKRVVGDVDVLGITLGVQT